MRPQGGSYTFGDHLGVAFVRAHLRLVRQFLQRVVVPELHLDAAVQAHAPGPVSFEASGCVAPRPSLSIAAVGSPSDSCMARATRCARAFDEREVVAVDALVAAAQRHVIGVADEPDRHVLLVAAGCRALAAPGS